MPFVFWHYILVDEVSRITLKKLLQSQKPAPDKVRWNYYKLRQVLQSAMNLLQIATSITKCDDY